jgi:hypothetical protein
MDVKIIPDSIRDVLDYDPETGDLTWKVGRRGTARAGCVAGWLGSTGYISLRFNRSSYLAHRVAWFLYHGEQPEVIDHINRKKSDNRIANLRSVDKSANELNHGKTGVRWYKTNGRYYAWARYKTKYLYAGKDIMTAHYRRIMAERADHPIGLPAPDAGH